MKIIEKTKNYEIFNKMSGNRPIDKSHLKKLRASIQKENALEIHPIIVNEDMCVIDGQHRLQVAKELGLDVYYVKSDTISDDHLQESNANQKSWEIENFIDLFAIRKKNQDYIRLKEIMKATGLRPKATLCFVLGNVNPVLIDFIKSGKFKFPSGYDEIISVDFFIDFKKYIEDKKIKPVSMFTTHVFTKAFRWLSKTTGFNKETFFKKLDIRWFDLRPQRSSEDWYKLLISIYNFKNHEKINDEWTA